MGARGVGRTLLIGCLLAAAQSPAAEKPVATAGEGRDGSSDFDFLVGRWKIHNRRLTRPLHGSTSWVEFEGTSVARKIWGGRANIDEYEAEGPSGRIQVLDLKLYDPHTRRWTLNLASSARGAFEKPMLGAFKDGRGEFFDEETYEGKTILVRQIWSGITPTAFRWEQAFSPDGGKTWEANWTMDLTRVE